MSTEDALRRRIEALKLAAEDGHAESMFLLAIAYAQGKGVPKDDVLAARWFHQAARRGHARARTSLAYMHFTGRGVRRDPVLAYVMCAQAADEGDPLARDLMAKLRRAMSPVQLREAERQLRHIQLRRA